MEPNFAEKERKIGGRTIIETLYNDIHVFVDKETGYYYAGVICSDNKKRFEHLAENQNYEAYKQAVSSTTGIPVVELEVVFESMGNGFRSKWIHPLLVNHVCEWADKLYAVKVSMLMNEKAKQALIEKKTLQEQIDIERQRTQTMQAKYKQLAISRDKALKKTKQQFKKETRAHQETKAKFEEFKEEAKARDQQAQAERQQLLEDVDTLHNMVFGVSSQVTDVKKMLNHRDEDFNYLTKAAGFVVHEMKKQTIANTRVESNTDILVIYSSKLKPASDDVRAQATETQIWLGTYNGDIENYNPSKLPSDYDELYYIASNRLNSFKYLLNHDEITPFIVRVYQRSILIEEEQLEDFIHKVDEVLNSNRKFKSVITLENARAKIESKKKQTKELRKQRDFKAHILNEYSPVHFIRNRFKRLLYCKPINEEGKEVLTPLADVDREVAVKSKWFYRYGSEGKYVQELPFSDIETAQFTKHGDARIHYEN